MADVKKDMEKKVIDLRESLMDSLPDEIDEELFRQLQDNINRTLKEYSGERSGDRKFDNEFINESGLLFDDDWEDSFEYDLEALESCEVPPEFEYDRIMAEMADVQMPESLEKRLREINENFLKEKEAELRKAARSRRMKRMRSVAAVIVAFAVISGGIVWKAPQAEAFRLKLYDTVFSPTDEDVGIKFKDTVYNDMPVIEDETLKAKVNEIIKRDGYILYPSVLPEGYELSEVSYNKKVRLKFVNEDRVITLNYFNMQGILNYTYNDVEKSENTEYLVNGQNAIIREDERRKEISWKFNNIEEILVFEETNYSDGLIIKIAEGVNKFVNIKL